MDPFHFISRYFWAIGIAFALFHYIKNQHQLKVADNDNTVNMEIKNQYARWFSLAAVFPWIVMGWGHIVGNVPSIWYYFRPQDQNPYVVAWFVLNFFLVLHSLCGSFSLMAHVKQENMSCFHLQECLAKPLYPKQRQSYLRLLVLFFSYFGFISYQQWMRQFQNESSNPSFKRDA